MSSTSGKEQFMKQFDAIVEGIKQNKVKVSTSKNKIKYLLIPIPVENYNTLNKYLCYTCQDISTYNNMLLVDSYFKTHIRDVQFHS
jgi:hypothetical protein